MTDWIQQNIKEEKSIYPNITKETLSFSWLEIAPFSGKDDIYSLIAYAYENYSVVCNAIST